MCLSGTWFWHIAYHNSNANIRFVAGVRWSLQSLWLCSFFFLYKTLEQLNTQRKHYYKKSQYGNLDLRKYVRKERAADAFYHWVIMSLVSLFLSMVLQISFCQGMSIYTTYFFWKKASVVGGPAVWCAEPLLLKRWSDFNLCSFFPCCFPPLTVFQSFSARLFAWLFSHSGEHWN